MSRVVKWRAVYRALIRRGYSRRAQFTAFFRSI
jgi:hypothetical protein